MYKVDRTPNDEGVDLGLAIIDSEPGQKDLPLCWIDESRVDELISELAKYSVRYHELIED